MILKISIEICGIPKIFENVLEMFEKYLRNFKIKRFKKFKKMDGMSAGHSLKKHFVVF